MGKVLKQDLNNLKFYIAEKERLLKEIEKIPLVINDKLVEYVDKMLNCNDSKYLEIIREVQTVSYKIINSCENKRNLNDNQLRSYCMGYIMSNIHSMPISYTILNINHSDEKIVKLLEEFSGLFKLMLAILCSISPNSIR